MLLTSVERRCLSNHAAGRLAIVIILHRRGRRRSLMRSMGPRDLGGRSLGHWALEALLVSRLTPCRLRRHVLSR
jgi:hypothetical protein